MANGYLAPWRRGSLAGSASRGGSLFDLHHQMNRLFDDLFDRGGGSPLSGGGLGAPALDLHSDETQIEITAELPGVKEQDIDLTIEDGVLILTGEKKGERHEQGGYSERSYGRFERRISLPSDVDEDGCAAEFRDGVLRVTLPRTQAKSRGRRIAIGEGDRTGIEAHNDPDSAPRQQAAQENAFERGEDGQQA